MLQLEWDTWWEAIPVLDAEEQIAAYTVGVLADAGWKLDREDILGQWREVIYRARRKASRAGAGDVSQAPAVDTAPGALRRTALRVREWLGRELSSGPKRGSVGWVERPRDDR